MDRTDPPHTEPPVPPPPVGEEERSETTPPAESSEPTADAPPAAPATPPRSHPSPYRVLANVVFVFLALFLFVRVAAVEPFGVPTGSMAPALIGNHRQADCPRCGHPVRVGAPNGVSPAVHYDRDHVACPNCLQHLSLLEARDLNGDRLLVDKNVFNLRRPRRWEMVVFHCPDTDPKEYRKPYVKRVVGLPGERILIIDGDVYVVGEDPADRELMRKGLGELRETRVPVFDMSHVARPGGWNQRWMAEPRENDPRLPEWSGRVAEPADSSVVASRELTLDAAATTQTIAVVSYRHWNLDTRREEVIRAWNSYDGVPARFDQLDAARDFSFECELEVVTATAAGRFACRLTDGADAVTAAVPVGRSPRPAATITHDGGETASTAEGVVLSAGSTYRFEFSFVDRRAILAIDGKPFGKPADLPAPSRPRPAIDVKHPLRPLRLEARGCRLVLRNVRLYRDTHYTADAGGHACFDAAGRPTPAVLGRDEYFMLGDNSSNSQDARKWPTPGVPEGEIIGKPFLVHQPLRPGRMTIGGRERHYQTVDWSRLRWLH